MQDLKCTHLSPFHEDIGSTSDGPFMSMTWLLSPMIHRPFTTFQRANISTSSRVSDRNPITQDAISVKILMGPFAMAPFSTSRK